MELNHNVLLLLLFIIFYYFYLLFHSSKKFHDLVELGVKNDFLCILWIALMRSCVIPPNIVWLVGDEFIARDCVQTHNQIHSKEYTFFVLFLPGVRFSYWLMIKVESYFTQFKTYRQNQCNRNKPNWCFASFFISSIRFFSL